MSIPTPPPMLGVYPDNVRPVSQITPFTYRDGLSYLKILETLIDYVNTKLVGYIQLSMDDIVHQLNTSIEELSQQIAYNEVEYNKLLDDYMSSVEYRIMEINNKTGELPIRRYQVTDDMTVNVEPVWPDRQQIILQFTQDYLGHDVEFKSTNAAPSPLPNATNGWTSTSSQWWPGHPDINAGRRPETNGYVTRRDISGPSPVISRIKNIGGINIPARHGREHTVSVYTHCTATDDYTVQLHVATDVENFDSPKLAASVDEQGWARTVYTFTMPTTTDVLNVSATVELAEGKSVGGEEVWWTDAQVERGGAPSAYRGVFANPYNIGVSRDPLITTQIECTPQPDGTWMLDSIRALYQKMEERLKEFERFLDQFVEDMRDELDAAISKVFNAHDGIVFAVNYGIKASPNGEVDSTEELRAAFNAAENKTLIIPPGVYGVSSYMELPQGINIQAHGVTLKRIPPFYTAILGNYSRTDKETKGYTGRGNITIEGMTFDGNNMESGGSMVTFIHSRDVTLRKCTWLSCTGLHMLEFNSSRECLVDECKFLGYKPIASYKTDKEAIQIDVARPNLTFGGAGDGTMTHNVTIRKCRFGSDSRGNGAPEVCVGSHSRTEGEFYTGITVDDCHGRGMSQAGVHGYCWSESNVTGNNFVVVDNGDGTAKAGVYLQACVETVVSGNSLSGSRTGTTDGVRCDDSSRMNVIGNNVIDGCRYGVCCFNTFATVISGNFMTNSYAQEVRLFNSTHVDIIGNMFHAPSTGKVDASGVVANTEGDGTNSPVNTVAGNTFYASDKTVATNAASYSGTLGRLYVTGNTVRGLGLSAGENVSTNGNNLL